MNSMNIVGYKIPHREHRKSLMSVPRINGKVWGAILLLIPLSLFCLEMRGIGKGLQKQDDILKVRYESQR